MSGPDSTMLTGRRESLGLLSSLRKVISRKLLKNVRMQGARSVFHLPVRQAILRVASRRIRSDSCHAAETVRRPEAYLAVRRNDEG